MCNSDPCFCHFSINAPIQNQLSINFKMRRPHTTSKSLPQSLTGCCSISDGEDESNTEGGEEEGFPTEGTIRDHTPSQEEMRRERQLEGLEAVGRSPRSSSMWLLTQMAAEVGPSTTSTEASCIRPTVGGRPPTKFHKGGVEEAPEVLAGDGSSPQDMPVPEEY